MTNQEILLYIYLPLHLVCIPIGYMLLKKAKQIPGMKWAIGDRKFGLLWATLLGPVAIISALFVLFIQDITSNDKPAKW